MKKTIIAMLALSGVAFGASATDLNTNLAGWMAEAGYTSGDYTLTFVVDGVGNNWQSYDVVGLAEGWTLYSQMGQYVGVNANGGGIEGWLGADGQAFNDSITVGSEGWLYNGGGQGWLNGATITIASSFNGLMNYMSISKGETMGVYAGLDKAIDLNAIDFKVAASQASLVIGGNSYDLTTAAPAPETPAVPEPTTATLSLLALAGLAARRRRK